MPSIFYEDYVPGEVLRYGGVTVDKAEMLAFAREFDAQPMHLSDESAKDTMAGELIASGWLTTALNMRMMADGFILESSSLGSPGVSELNWLRPVRAGDRLTAERHVLGRRLSASKPDRGFVNLHLKVFNQRGEQVLAQTNISMFGRRGSGAMADEGEVPATPEPELPVFRDVPLNGASFYEDLAVGDRVDLGSVAFSEADVVRFAKAYDPQFFHIDPVAAKTSIFGGLIASGWHTGAAWMGRMVRSRMTAAAAAAAKGERPARLGPSPGFRNLRWIGPVRAGDTIRYSSAIFEKRLSASRPEWGIVRHYNTGVNQRGETVFSFIGSVFWERRPT